MNPETAVWRRAGAAWLDFWFPAPSHTLLAAMRIAVGLLVLYVFLVRSYDLELHFAGPLFAGGVDGGEAGGLAWPFSLFHWFNGRVWLWTVHLTGIAVVLAFCLGVFPAATGFLALVFHLSYLHGNPAVVMGLDGLVTLGLAYLTLMPCGRRMTVLWWLHIPVGRAPLPAAAAEESPPWSGLVLRALQIHLCVVYFQSGLAKLQAGWLTGAALWHPLLVAKGAPVEPETLAAFPALASLIPYTLALFELFFPVLVWVPRLRYPALAVALVAHLAVGALWEKLPFNLLMLALAASFLRGEHVEWLRERLLRLIPPPETLGLARPPR